MILILREEEYKELKRQPHFSKNKIVVVISSKEIKIVKNNRGLTGVYTVNDLIRLLREVIHIMKGKK